MTASNPYSRMGISSLLRSLPLCLAFCLTFSANALAHPFDELRRNDDQQTLLNQDPSAGPFLTTPQESITEGSWPSSTLKNLLDALDVMQSAYFELWEGTWPTSIDWTAAVLGTQVSATLSALTTRLDDILTSNSTAAGGFDPHESRPFGARAYENLIDYYFHHTSAFYFGEDAFAVRQQAYDDMLWVVLGWLENIKFQNLHSGLHYSSHSAVNNSPWSSWHGTQFRAPAAHRARLFYDLASRGWDTSLCGGGMIWSPYLTPYKNAITNELFISASIGMYLYFPGDQISSPFQTGLDSDGIVPIPHNRFYLDAAVVSYDWLKNSNMTGENGLYGDGFHIRGWSSPHHPGTKNCDVLNTMVFTYNQGVVLSGLRGLWLATCSREYLKDGHELIDNVIKTTGWPYIWSREWRGLGRGGVLEEICDSSGRCSQNSHTFKGIFFHHFAEFCRPLNPQEKDFLRSPESGSPGFDEDDKLRWAYEWHQRKCSTYRDWIEHNANAALVTKNEAGKFGMWWGREYPYRDPNPAETSALPEGAVDYINSGPFPPYSETPPSLLGNNDTGGRDKKHKACRSSRMGKDVAGETKAPYEKDNDMLESDPLNNLSPDVNDRYRGRTVETQSGGVAVLRALYQWESSPSLAGSSDPNVNIDE